MSAANPNIERQERWGSLTLTPTYEYIDNGDAAGEPMGFAGFPL